MAFQTTVMSSIVSGFYRQFSPLLILSATFIIILLLVLSVLRSRRKSPYYFLPGPKASSKLGFLLDLHNPEGLQWHLEMIQKYGHVAKLDGGLVGSNALYITDPSALHTILVRNVHTFQESTEFAGLFGLIHHGDGLASVSGEEHKRQRKLVDPIFTTSCISRLTPLFFNVTRQHQLQASLNADLADSPQGQEIDILDRLVRTTLELIAQAGLGHTFNSFDRESKQFNEFHWAITSVLLVTYVPWSAPREFKKACEVMHPVYEKLLDEKQALFRKGGMSALEESATNGKDLMTILFKSNWEAEKEDRLSDEVVIANMGSIVHGAQETTSGRKGNNKDFDFRELEDLPLLDAVCRETLRLFTPVTTMDDTVVPLRYPILDPVTKIETRSLLITKGTPVYLGLAAVNRSKEVWGPDASEFKPERWMRKNGREMMANEAARLPGLYSNMMTFLGGPRACPGMRFAVHEIKLVLSVLLQSYSFAPSEKDIDWKLYITLTPYAKGESIPQVPVKVTML
ncbi:hypothetical protein H0H92_012987 [Tricholoma furcatifolium]|nr:hypothetical protein H0H92_012987 [Tricholoma furcatifolium]